MSQNKKTKKDDSPLSGMDKILRSAEKLAKHEPKILKRLEGDSKMEALQNDLLKALKRELTSDIIEHKIDELNNVSEKKQYLIELKYQLQKDFSHIEEHVFTRQDDIWRQEVYSTIEKHLSLLDIKNTGSNGRSKNRIALTYIWLHDPQVQLPDLYNRMKDFFDTDEELFVKLFSGVPVDDAEFPVQLKKAMTNELLAYFLVGIDRRSFIQKTNWQNIAGEGKFFKNYAGKILTANDLAVATSANKNNSLPRGAEKIDLILERIKKP